VTQRMLSPVAIRPTMLLADSAQVAEGKLYVLGGGWSITGPQPTPQAVAMYLEVSWDLTNMRHTWELELLDSDGQPVMVPGPVEEQPVKLGGDFEVGRPPGLHPGTPIGIALAINIGPLELPPNGRYEWRLKINGEAGEDWRLTFSTRPAPTQGPPSI
jgi:hypothetical protein